MGFAALNDVMRRRLSERGLLRSVAGTRVVQGANTWLEQEFGKDAVRFAQAVALQHQQLLVAVSSPVAAEAMRQRHDRLLQYLQERYSADMVQSIRYQLR